VAIPQDLSWLPKYPTTVPGAVLLGASYQPFYAGASYPESPALAWAAEYPDFALGTRLRQQPTPVFLRQPEPFLAQFSWHGWQPDWLARRVFHASRQQTLAFDGRASLPAAVVPDLSWRAQYPDQIDRRRLHPSVVANQARLPFFRATELTTFPLYPDLIARVQVHASQQQAWFFEGRVLIPPPDLSWRAIYPDWIAALESLRPAQQVAWAFHPDPVPDPVPEATTWYPTFPERIEPSKGLRADLQQVFTININPIPRPAVPDGLPWRTQGPDWLPGHPPVRVDLVRVTTPIAPTIPLDLRWAPIYPDARGRLVLTTTGVVVTPLVPDLPSVEVATSAQAFYPDYLWPPQPVRDHLGWDPLSSAAMLIPILPPECIEWLDQDLTTAALIDEDLSVPIFSRESGTIGEFLEEGC